MPIFHHHLNAARHPVVLAGVELPRFGLAEAALRLVEKVELPYATTVSSKSALPELHPQFIGLYQGALSRPEVKREVEAADCVLSLGVWMTDLDTGGFSVKLAADRLIAAGNGTVRRFFTRLDGFLNDDMVLLVEPGDAVCAAPELYIEEPENFIAQAYYLSIGYCTPAAHTTISATGSTTACRRCWGEELSSPGASPPKANWRRR